MSSTSISLRCSSLDRVLNCPASLQMEPLLPNKGDGVESREGQYLHWLAHAKIAADMGGVGNLEKPAAVPPNIQLSAWIAEFYMRAVQERVPNDWSLEMEGDFETEFILPRPAHGISSFFLSGHPDDIAMNRDATEAIGFDLKCGYDPVDPAEMNEQVFGYSILLADAYPSLKKITYYIIQPRNDEDTGFDRISKPMVLEGDALVRAREVFVDRVNVAIENFWQTNSGQKQCRWCKVAKQRPFDCPSLSADSQLMKATLTPSALDALRAAPDDGKLGDFVITGRTLTEPIKAATEMLHERLDARGYVDAACGTRITRTTRPGAYEIPDKMAFHERLKDVLPDEKDRAECASYSMDELKKRIASVRKIPQKSTVRGTLDARQVFDLDLRPLVKQGESRILVFSA